jgi:DNA-binding transcriptional MerR regulator
MSLKAIKELLSQYEDMIGASTSEIGTAATAEIAALEKAAKELDDDEVRRAVRHAPDVIHEALALFATIAKEAK